tara:strand:+ start:2816 stop:4054 length:1239 start_codon:yes stop_codon:yes gene_type:complete
MNILKRNLFFETVFTLSVILSISDIDNILFGQDIGIYLLIASLGFFYLNKKRSEPKLENFLYIKKFVFINISIYCLFAFLQFLHVSFGGRLIHDLLELDVTGNPLSFLKSASIIFFTYICLNKSFLKIIKKTFFNITFFSYPQLFLSLKFPIFFKLFEHDTIYGGSSLRFVPYIADPNFFAIFLISSLLIHLYSNPKSDNNYFFHLQTASLTLLPIFLGSKTAFSVLVLILLIRYVSLPKLIYEYKFSKTLFYILFVLVFSTFVYIVFGPENNEFSKIIPSIIDGEIFSQRLYMWQSDIVNQIFNSKYLFFGKGFGYSRSILGVYMHNDYLEYFISFGIFGFILLLISKQTLNNILKYSDLKITLSIFFLIYFIPIFFSVNSNSFYVTSIFWTTIILSQSSFNKIKRIEYKK